MSKYQGNTSHKFLNIPDTTLAIYNCWDAHETAKLVVPLRNELISHGQWENYKNVLMPFQRAIVNMQRRGMLLDRAALRTYKGRVTRELGRSDETIVSADPTGRIGQPTGKSRNSIGSPPKLGALLFQELGLKSSKPTDTGADSTDQEALYRILRDLRKKDEHARPVLEALFHRSRLKTIYQRYLTLDPDPDGRVRAIVKLAGTKTGRLAYSEPALQQFPPEARHVFRASPGRAYLAVDYSQVEARILAWLSGDHVSIGCFRAGDDVHIQNARDLFSYSDAEWASLGSESRGLSRGVAKTFLYGISYGGAAETMKAKMFCPCPKCAAHAPATMKVTKAKMSAMAEQWHRRHPAVQTFHDELKHCVTRDHYWECPLGGRRYFTAPWSAELERESKNAPMQATAAQLMNIKQVELDQLGAPIVMQKHDEFIFEVPENEVESWRDRIVEVMERPATTEGPLANVSFPVDCEVGETWGTLEKLAP